MFKSNTAREIFYIFLWLAGITLLYTLVFIFILEPSQSENEVKHSVLSKTANTKHVMSEKAIVKKNVSLSNKEKIAEKPVQKTIKPKIISTPSIVKVVNIPQSKMSVPTIPSVPSLPLIPDTKKSIKREIKTVVKTVKKTLIPQAISIPKIPKIINVPQKNISIPSIPSTANLPSINNIDIKISTVRTKEIPKKKTHLTQDVQKKVLSKDITIKRIETERQHLRQEALKIREEAIKLLSK